MPSAHRAGVAGRARHSSPRAAAHRRSAGRRCPTRPIPMRGRRVRPARSPAVAADRAAAIAATGDTPSPRPRDPHGRRAGRRRPAKCGSPPGARSRCSDRTKARAPGRCRPPRARPAASPTTRPRWSPAPRGGDPGDRAAGLRTASPPAVRRAGRGRRCPLTRHPPASPPPARSRAGPAGTPAHRRGA